MKNVLIRKMIKEDIDEVIKIYASITQKPNKKEFKGVVEDQIQKEGNACLVAEHNGRIVGYIITYVLSCSFGIQKSAWIPMVGVKPEFMGRGIGQEMGESIMKYYKNMGIKNIYTSVRWFDGDVLSFFKKLGFDRSEFINLRKNFD